MTQRLIGIKPNFRRVLRNRRIHQADKSRIAIKAQEARKQRQRKRCKMHLLRLRMKGRAD